MVAKPTSILECINQNTRYIANLANSLGMDPDSSVADIESALASYVQSAVTETAINSAYSESEEPTTLQTSKGLFFFANGTPITITAREDKNPGATITWDNGSLDVTSDANIFGGRHDDDTKTNTSVTMKSGTVNLICGGGMHKSHTVIAKLTMTGGTVKSIQGAGCSSFTHDCGCENATPWYAGDPVDSPCITEDATLTLTGGECTALVYGGGEGISYTKKSTVNIGGTFKAYYVTPGGSNGGTTSANVKVSGNAEIKVLQGINRGTVDTITEVIDGGKIYKMFAGAEIPFKGSPENPDTTNSDATGTFKKCIVSISKNANIVEFSLGGNSYVAIPEKNDYVVITK